MTETISKIKSALDIGKEMLNLPPNGLEPMSKDVAMSFLKVGVASKENLPLPPQFKDLMAFKILDSRAQAHGVQIDEYVKVMICLLVDRPGTIIMWIAAIHALNHKLKRTATFDDLVYAFAGGFPKEESLHTIWDNQKVHRETAGQSDNSLDYGESWVLT